MKKLYMFLCMASLVCCSTAVKAQCSNGRYYDKIFQSGTTTVTYGNAMKFDSTYTDLKVDIYQPTGDNFAHRPLMIFAFGGSFTAGIRQSPDLVQICTDFSQRGYVCASIDYRLGFEGGSDCDTNQFKAMMRGVQDMKAAVRFFYKDACTVNAYHIDTNQIFIGGVSAGAFMALNYAYLKYDTLSKPAPNWAVPALLALGGPDGNSGNPGYSQKVKGVIDLCGGLADTVWIMPNDPILVGVHGTADGTVSCYYDSTYASTHPESLLFGGGDIKNRLDDIGVTHSFKLFYGASHVPFVLPIPFVSPAKEYMDTTIWLIRDFLYQNVTCDSTLMISGIDEIESKAAVSVYPNPSEDIMYVKSNCEKDLTMQLVGIDGKLIEQGNLASYETQTISKQTVAPGIYLLQFLSKSRGGILKTEKIVFY